MDDTTVTNTNPAPGVDAPAAETPTLTVEERLMYVERQLSSCLGLNADAMRQLAWQLHERMHREASEQRELYWQTYNAALYVAYMWACRTHDKLPDIVAQSDRIAHLFATGAHGPLNAEAKS